jgi:ABC-type Fe3+-siderophore transport system permease subunit
MSISSRWKLITAGILSGAIINIAQSIFLHIIPSLLLATPYIILAIVMICVVSYSWSNEKRLRDIHKLRLVFFGISAASFVFALIDVLQFVLTYSVNSILVYNGPPYLTVGGIPFVSVLLSFALGGFFSVAERYLDLHEKKDL